VNFPSAELISLKAVKQSRKLSNSLTEKQEWDLVDKCLVCTLRSGHHTRDSSIAVLGGSNR